MVTLYFYLQRINFKWRSAKLILPILLFCLPWLALPTTAKALEISAIDFHDQALKQCITKLSNKNHWHSSEQVTKIKCHGQGIKNIVDLNNFPNLNYLSLFNNQIINADLSSLTQLSYVNLANNQLTFITLSNLTQLKTLYVFKNRLTTINFTGLSSLKKIRATNNLLNKLDISPLVSLEKAYFFNNKLKDLSVKGMPKLKFIELRQNPMSDEVYDRYDEIDGITIVHDGNADDWK